MISAILLLAGRGERFGSELPKQFHLLNGRYLFEYALESLQRSVLFDEIVLVAPKGSSLSLGGVTITAGGSTRQESSYRGLLACSPKTEIVLIHDGVRPFLSQKIIYDNIEAAKVHGAVDTCIASADTIVKSKEGEMIDEIPPRKEYFRGQTPQTFRYPLIVKAHQSSKRINSTDDCSLVLDLGHPVHIVEGSEENIKITHPIDLFLAEQMISLAAKKRTATL